jgi:steroid delta-isomerase-like uncharacterized protein
MNSTVTSIEENKRLAARPHEEVFNQGNLDAADGIFSSDFAQYEPHLPPLPRGPEGVKRLASMLRAAFPDLQLRLDETVAEGDNVVHHWTFQGTHQGEFNGISATGRRVVISGIDIWRVRDGKLTENQQIVDNLSLLEQLGVVPLTGQAET